VENAIAKNLHKHQDNLRGDRLETIKKDFISSYKTSRTILAIALIYIDYL